METTVTNLDKFNALIAKHGIRIDDTAAIRVGATDYLDNPIVGKTFAGIDPSGRAFINVSVVGHVVSCGTVDVEAGDHFAFIVFQRYFGNEEIFAIGGEPYPISRDNLLLIGKNDEHDFSKPDRLLSGESIKFHQVGYKDGKPTDDPDNFIEVMIPPR